MSILSKQGLYLAGILALLLGVPACAEGPEDAPSQDDEAVFDEASGIDDTVGDYDSDAAGEVSDSLPESGPMPSDSLL